MIISRSPLRICLGGGGTDLPSYYREHTGFVIAAAIDKYVYITLHHTFQNELIIKYSKMERVHSVDEIQHPIIREALRLTGATAPCLEVTCMADIPAGTGLGSSGSFTTALLEALHRLTRNLVHPNELAEQACHIEIDLLKEPVGKQDQYIAAYGGLTCFRFLPDGKVAGSGGCNRYNGSATLKGPQITFAPLASTMMACAPALMDQEMRFFAALSKADTVSFDKTGALLIQVKGEPKPLLFRKET
jgi:heat shock protein HslJ